MSMYDWTGAIKITFDKPIINNPDIIIGSELNNKIIPDGSPSASSNESGFYPYYAFNNSVTDGESWFTRSSLPQWLQYAFGSAKTIGGIRIYQPSSYMIKDAIVKASSDNSNWVDVATVSFPNATGWQSAIFNEASYRYWRLHITSKWGTYTQTIEMEFYSIRTLYLTAGWTVTGFEYNRVPNGELIPVSYTVRRVTKSEDNLSIILWLDLKGRMKAPIGDITVSYNKTLGNLIGPYNALVESFSMVFTPQNIVPIYLQPHSIENLSASAALTLATHAVNYKYIPSTDNTFLVAKIDSEHMDEALLATPNLTLVVTKVGDLPL